MLARLVLRPDRAMAVAATGLAAAILLPVVGTLILAGLQPTLPDGTVAYAADRGGIDVTAASAVPTLVVSVSNSNASLYAYRVGNPIVRQGERLAMPEGNDALSPVASATLPGLPPDAILVHPDDLGPSRDVLATFPGLVRLPGAVVAQERGVDAFEAKTTASLRGQASALVVLSIPAVALVASAFARQEARARRRQSSVLAALGSPRMAFLALAVRCIGTAALGGLLAATAGAAIYRFGGPLTHPIDAPRLALAIAIALPTVAAAATGLLWSWLSLRDLSALRTAGPMGEDDVTFPLPAPARPLVLGLRPLGILFVSALLFAADVGFPLAAAKVPASLAGGDDEWVFGGEDGIVVGQGVAAGLGDVAHLDARITDSLAETVTPTLVDGRPAVVRGGTWERLASYHGLHLRGDAPGPDGIVLGDRLARRLGVEDGNEVVVQGGHKPDAVLLQVTGIATGPNLLRDEAFVNEAVGRRLAGLPEGQASLLHVRPQTQRALDALARVEPNLVVEAIAVHPSLPVTGTLAEAVVRVANTGSQAGQQALTLRVNGEAQETRTVTAAGHAITELRIPFLVPPGPLRLDVNPTGNAQTAAPDLEWAAPDRIRLGEPIVAHLTRAGAPVEDMEAALFADAAAVAANRTTAVGRTDAEGGVSFTPPAPGSWLVGTLGGETALRKVQVADPAAGIVVEAVWTEPATLVLRETNTLKAQVRNQGDTPANATLGAYVGTLRFSEAYVELAPGDAAVLSFHLYIIEPAQNVSVGGLNLRLVADAVGGEVPGTEAPGGPGTLGPPRAGATVQTQVADRALGDARAILIGLAGSAVISTLAVVALASRRAMAGRRHVLSLLGVLGWDFERVRQRAALEGAVLGTVASLTALVPVKLAFIVAGAYGPPVFAHGLPDPIDWLFALQTTAAFAGVCALACYFAVEQEWAARARQ